MSRSLRVAVAPDAYRHAKVEKKSHHHGSKWPGRAVVSEREQGQVEIENVD
ncbi:hypothetical protein [Endozoicomonas sp.]|uniref:hypothetical protein n=1 Tax=Endozoicomonas sp. TaxID=1892382 RepID=UPI00288392BC|nr:hypothetical protein [Endozoicomonas sp.]